MRDPTALAAALVHQRGTPRCPFPRPRPREPPKAFGDRQHSLVELPAPVTKNPPACSFVSTKGQIGRLDKARSQRSTARWLGRHYGPSNIPCTTGYKREGSCTICKRILRVNCKHPRGCAT